MRKIPQQAWSTIFMVMIVMVPAVLYMQLVVESANEKEMQILANIQNKVGGNPIMNLQEEGAQIAKCVSTRGQKQCWRELKRKVWLTGLNEIEKMPESSLSKFENPTGGWEIFDMVTPTHECDLNDFYRVGEGDGGKWICGPLTVHNDDKCAIFSLGSNGQFGFEQNMQKLTAGKCQMYTFDCTGTWSDPSTNFYPWCIAGSDYTDNGKIYKRISTIFKELNLQDINYLKMDIEGYEWSVFNDILKPENKFALPRQISFELHVGSFAEPGVPKEFFKPNSKNWAYPMIKLMRLIDGAGYRFAASERNPYCTFCFEYVIVREDVV